MHEAEWLTRKLRIDKRLQALNPKWQIIPYRPGLDIAALSCHAVTEFPTANGPADYGFRAMLLKAVPATRGTGNPIKWRFAT
jgi:hypothetical protein